MIYSNRLNLRKPAGTDPFLLTDFNFNWDELDKSPGVWVCTSSSRPPWGVDEAGRMILETDTKKMFIWPGSGSFVEVINTTAANANTTALAAQSTANTALAKANSLEGGTATDGVARTQANNAYTLAASTDTALDTHVDGGGGTDASTGSQHHTLGVGSLQAARGNHTHTNYGFDINTGSSTGDNGNRTISSTSSSAPTLIDTLTFTLSAQTSVLILGECSYEMQGILYSNYIYTGFRVDGAVIGNTTVVGGGNLDSDKRMFTQASIHRLQTLNAGSHTITLNAYKDTTALVAQATLYRLTVVPIKAFA